VWSHVFALIVAQEAI